MLCQEERWQKRVMHLQEMTVERANGHEYCSLREHKIRRLLCLVYFRGQRKICLFQEEAILSLNLMGITAVIELDTCCIANVSQLRPIDSQ